MYRTLLVKEKKQVTSGIDFLAWKRFITLSISNPELFFFQLICDAVLTAAGQIHQLLYQNKEFELDVPLIHYSYSLIQARLANFSDLVHAFPDLVEKLLTLRDRLDVGEVVSHTVLLSK